MAASGDLVTAKRPALSPIHDGSRAEPRHRG